MYVGVLRLALTIPGARSLKDKRRVAQSAKERWAARFRVAVAEVGALEFPSRLELGVCTVANDAAQCQRVLEAVSSAADTLADAFVSDRRSEVIAMGFGGAGIQDGIEKWKADDA